MELVQALKQRGSQPEEVHLLVPRSQMDRQMGSLAYCLEEALQQRLPDEVPQRQREHNRTTQQLMMPKRMYSVS
jgi:hypothetical protein